MSQIYNFSAGPAALPVEVMQQAQAEFLNWQGKGLSAMEISHRHSWFMSMVEQTEQDLRELLAIPKQYKVLFLAGGASFQFAMIPMNLLRGKNSADYINTGIWSQKAITEAKRYCQVNIAASGESSQFNSIPDFNQWQLNPHAAYVHYAANETISGLEFPYIPETGDIPLVTDMSSNILSAPLDVSRFGLIYAGAQKNIGPSGLSVVIVREDLLGDVLPFTPTLYNYQIQAENNSMYNTPPTYAWYIAGLVFAWLKKQGGLAIIAERNRHKAEKLYTYIDQSEFYFNTIDVRYRSKMNVTFRLKQSELEPLFIKQAEQAGLFALNGHKSAGGGMRASIYNAMPEAGIDRLIEFMHAFKSK